MYEWILKNENKLNTTIYESHHIDYSSSKKITLKHNILNKNAIL